MPVRGEDAVRSYIAGLIQAAGFEVLIGERNGKIVSNRLTGDLAKDEVVTLHG